MDVVVGIRVSATENVTGVAGTVNEGLGAVERSAVRTHLALLMVVGAIAKIAQEAVSLLTDIIEPSMNFQQAMQNTFSVTGDVVEVMERLTTAAREMGVETGMGATAAAEAMYFFGSAGFAADEIISALHGTMILAGATQTSLTDTSQTVAAALAQFGLDASETDRIVNAMAAGIAETQLTMGRLADGMKYTGPLAREVGMSFEQTTAALGLLNNAGLFGEIAGTGLRRAITALISPTQVAEGVMRKLGLSFEQINPVTQGFANVLDVLRQHGMSAGDAMKMFGQRAGPAMLVLLRQGTAGLNDMTSAVTGTQKAQEMYNTQMDSLIGSLKFFKAALDDLYYGLFEQVEPAIRKIVDTGTEWVNAMRGWSDTTKTVMIVLLAFVAVLATLMVPLTLITMYAGAFAAVFTLIGTILLYVVGVIFGIGIAIGALAVILNLFGVSWSEAWEWAQKTFTEASDEIIKKTKELWDAIAFFWWEVEPQWNTAWYNMQEKSRSALAEIVSIAKEAFAGFWDHASTTMETTESRWEEFWAKMQEAEDVSFLNIESDYTQFWESFFEFWRSMLDGIVNLFSNALNVILDVCNVILDLLSGRWWEFGDSLIKLVRDVFKLVADIFSDSLKVIWLGLKAGLDLLLGTFGLSMDELIERAREAWTLMIEDLKDMLWSFENIGISIVKSIWTGIANTWDAFKAWFWGQWNAFWSYFPGFGTGGGGAPGGGAGGAPGGGERRAAGTPFFPYVIPPMPTLAMAGVPQATGRGQVRMTVNFNAPIYGVTGGIREVAKILKKELNTLTEMEVW